MHWSLTVSFDPSLFMVAIASQQLRLPSTTQQIRLLLTIFPEKKYCCLMVFTLPVCCNTERVRELPVMVYAVDLKGGVTCSIREFNVIRPVQQPFLIALSITCDLLLLLYNCRTHTCEQLYIVQFKCVCKLQLLKCNVLANQDCRSNVNCSKCMAFQCNCFTQNQ